MKLYVANSDIFKEIELKYLEKMKEIYRGDVEIAHGRADDLLCQLLSELGFSKLVEEYNSIPKWYA